LTINCINSILSNNENSTIIVVDNNSEETEKQKLKEWQSKNNAFASKVTILYELKNLGYFGALNIGLELIKNDIYNFDYVTIGNNDLIFDAEYFNTLASNEFTNDIFVIAPNIIKPNGIHQNPYAIRPVSKVRKILYYLLYSHYYVAKIIFMVSTILNSGKSDKSRLGFEQTQIIFAGHGACYVLTKYFFKYNHLLDASSFLMGEEFILAKQIHDTGGKIMYISDLKVIHNEHSTMKKIPSRVIYKYSQNAFRIFKNIC
jgi:GT2 family glycosyltransferase